LPENLSTTDIARAEILLRIIVLAVLLETAGIDEEKGREILDDEYSGVDRIIELSTGLSSSHRLSMPPIVPAVLRRI
jgi:hypothetical protein